MTFTATHRLSQSVTQGVQGPSRPPLTFPATTAVEMTAAIGDLAYAVTADGWQLVLRISEEMTPILGVV